MAYEPYADAEYYHNTYGGASIPADSLAKALTTASRHIDTLTFNRIVGRGFDNLTAFQQDIIKEVVCRQAEFETEHADILESVLSSYSINGVSMGFSGSSWNVHAENGVAMDQNNYALLAQTGLCCRIAG